MWKTFLIHYIYIFINSGWIIAQGQPRILKQIVQNDHYSMRLYGRVVFPNKVIIVWFEGSLNAHNVARKK